MYTNLYLKIKNNCKLFNRKAYIVRDRVVPGKFVNCGVRRAVGMLRWVCSSNEMLGAHIEISNRLQRRGFRYFPESISRRVFASDFASTTTSSVGATVAAIGWSLSVKGV